jgi:hypothetical protein
MMKIIVFHNKVAAAHTRIGIDYAPTNLMIALPVDMEEGSEKNEDSMVNIMKCYICAKEGKDSDAVAVCVSCGMGTCMTHTIRKEVEVWEGTYPLPSRKLPAKMPRMLCTYCSVAYGDGK